MIERGILCLVKVLITFSSENGDYNSKRIYKFILMAISILQKKLKQTCFVNNHRGGGRG